MTINIFVLKLDLNGKIVVVRFFFCRVYVCVFKPHDFMLSFIAKACLWLSFVVSSVSLSLSHWYPGSGVVLDCIDS